MKSIKWLIIAALMLVFACKSQAQYHIIVECYGDPIAGDQFYHIKFTPNNWKNSNEIHNTDNISNFASADIDDMREYEDVDYTPFISKNKYLLISVAKRLKTIKMANHYNDSVSVRYNRLHKYYMSIKPKFEPLYHPLKKKCCTVTKIY